MALKFNPHLARRLAVAGFAFGVAAVQAASGIAVSRSQGFAVRAGMTTAEVREILGRPASVFNFRSAPGPTWTYHVVGAPYGTTEFNVEFGSDDRVIAARERALPSGG